MGELTLAEFSKNVEVQMPLLYVGGGLFFLGWVIMFVLILNYIFSFIENKRISRSDKRMLIISSVVLIAQVSGVCIYFWAIIRVAS